jgi:hypothetical protein
VSRITNKHRIINSVRPALAGIQNGLNNSPFGITK